jgi:hypothetical protein
MAVLIRCVLACLLGIFSADAAAADDSWELQLPGLSHHFGSPEQPGKSWTDFHDGLGLQRTSRRTDAVIRYTAGFTRDSFGAQGLYAGAAFGYRLLEGALEVDVSAVPMLLYRTTRFDGARGPAPYKLIPIVMPLLSVEHRASGIGANMTVLPAGNFGKELRFPGLVFVQFTYRLR